MTGNLHLGDCGAGVALREEHLAQVPVSGELLDPAASRPGHRPSAGSRTPVWWSLPAPAGPSSTGGSPAAGTAPVREEPSCSLAEARKRIGLTARAVAAALHVSRATVSRWEVGTHRPAGSYLEPLSAVLRISTSEIEDILERHPPSRADASTLLGLRELRARQGLSAAACARALDVAPSTWSNWERGKTPVPRHVTAELARLLATGEQNLHRRMGSSATATPATVWSSLRRRAGMTQREAAALLGIGVSHLSRIENGHRPPPARLADRMCRVYASATPGRNGSAGGRQRLDVLTMRAVDGR